MTMVAPPLPLLVGCGILRKEIASLIAKNNWQLETCFIDSSLHIDFDKLGQALTSELASHPGRDMIVFYGACHPLMDAMLETAGTFRIEGQNCVEMLLGRELFTRGLEQGAFFLLEEWAQQWERIVTATIGSNPEVIRDIYQGDRNYLLCITTPCSGDFTAEAEAAGRLVGLPLRWLHVSLDHLEKLLRTSLERRADRRHE